MSIAIVTDSTSDLPDALLESAEIHSIPTILIMDEQEMEDGCGISRQAFYEKLPRMKTPPTTASPSSGTFHSLYSRLLQSGIDQIISIHVSSTLSGVLSAAQVAKQGFGRRVHLIDSGQVSLGLGFQALVAAESARATQSLERVLEAINDVRRRIHLVAMLDTMEYVRRSGRVNWARANIGALLQIKPFLSVKDGNVLRLGEARTRHKGIDRLCLMLSELGKLSRLAILHTNAPTDAQMLLEKFSPQSETEPLVVNVTSVIGTHVGPNGLGFVAVVK